MFGLGGKVIKEVRWTSISPNYVYKRSCNPLIHNKNNDCKYYKIKYLKKVGERWINFIRKYLGK